MAFAAKIYKTHNTSSALAQLTDSTLRTLGVQHHDDRKLVLAAIKKANLRADSTSLEHDAPSAPLKKLGDITSVGSSAVSPSNDLRNSSSPSISKTKKRKRGGDAMSNPLPDRAPDDGDTYGSSDFGEILDPDVLRTKSTVVNRAPMMTAWAMIVAERLGFQREEALSIASVYTELNAISKGVSLGIYKQDKSKMIDSISGDAQPYIDLMGLRIPLYKATITADTTEWRALSASSPIPPSSAYKYITSSLRQTAPFIIGALRLLAQSYEPGELNKKGFSLYADFRPDVESGKNGWGMKGVVKCQTILDLMKKGTAANSAAEVVKIGPSDGEPDTKRSRNLNSEGYDTMLDDSIFEQIDLEGLP